MYPEAFRRAVGMGGVGLGDTGCCLDPTGVTCSPFNPGGCTQAVADGAGQVAGWLASMGAPAIAIFKFFGFVGTDFQLTAFTQVLQGKFDGPALWQALQSDYQTFLQDKSVAEALQDGDYRKAWNLATDNGHAYDQLKASLGIDQPQPTPDPSHATDASNLVAQASQPGADVRGLAQQAYDWGYYPFGDTLDAQWSASLINSPLGMLGQTAVAESTNDPVAMMVTAAKLAVAMNDPGVIAAWQAAQYPSAPSDVATPLIQALGQKAQAATESAAGASATSSSSTSTGATVALVGAGVVGAGALGILAYAKTQHMAYRQAARHLWSKVSGRR